MGAPKFSPTRDNFTKLERPTIDGGITPVSAKIGEPLPAWTNSVTESFTQVR